VTPSRYLAWLHERTGCIEISPQPTGAAQSHRVPFEDFFIDLVSTEGEPLEDTLRHPRLLILGEPGSGKTTFLRRVARAKACDASEELPFLIRLADLDARLRHPPEPAAWLPHYLAQLSLEHDWGLDEAFFHRQLTERPSLVLLDGLDEAPHGMARLLESTAHLYANARFVVTTRPEGAPRLAGFREVMIADLDPEDFESILERWTPFLHPGEALLRTLRARLELRDLARHPAVLTTLALVRWHDEQGVPVPRADIYESIVASLIRDPDDAASVCFRQPILQNYLVARTCADLPDDERNRLLFQEGRIYHSEWREPLRLLGGLLMRRGAAPLDALISAILDNAGQSETGRIRGAGVLGLLLRDLLPLRYEPADARYRQFVQQALDVFEPAAKSVDLMTRVDAAEAVGQAGDPRLHRDNWIAIPPCAFSRSDGAKTQEVELSAYRIARFPVTVQEYAKFLRAANPPPDTPEDWDEQQLHPNRPVVGLGWDEAGAYCAWAGCRLATEAEWERAARGASGTIFPWGDALPDLNLANFKETGIGAPAPVGLFPEGRSPEGVADLIGNVWEWVEDWYAPYQPSHIRDPRGPAKGEFKVLRGNSWRDRAKSLGTAATRAWEDPAARDNHVGFRCVREPLQ
jgi:formylglycine-generating enzyme required for sulfatase activity/DNA polymerase III delta prime subunit